MNRLISNSAPHSHRSAHKHSSISRAQSNVTIRRIRGRQKKKQLSSVSKLSAKIDILPIDIKTPVTTSTWANSTDYTIQKKKKQIFTKK